MKFFYKEYRHSPCWFPIVILSFWNHHPKAQTLVPERKISEEIKPQTKRKPIPNPFCLGGDGGQELLSTLYDHWRTPFFPTAAEMFTTIAQLSSPTFLWSEAPLTSKYEIPMAFSVKTAFSTYASFFSHIHLQCFMKCFKFSSYPSKQLFSNFTSITNCKLHSFLSTTVHTYFTFLLPRAQRQQGQINCNDCLAPGLAVALREGWRVGYSWTWAEALLRASG